MLGICLAASNHMQHNTQNTRKCFPQETPMLCICSTYAQPLFLVRLEERVPCSSVALALHMLGISSRLTQRGLGVGALSLWCTWYMLSICTAYPQFGNLRGAGEGEEEPSSSSRGGGAGPR